MPYVGRSATLRLSSVMPTVVRNDAGQWAKMSDDIREQYREAFAYALDRFTNRVAARSLELVPKGPRGEDEESGDETLAESIRYPGNDYSYSAMNYADLHGMYMSASIEYTAPYAAVQHEGMALMEHHHPIIPGRRGFFELTSKEAEIIVQWQAREYTTPGTQDHFLSEPMRSAIPRMEGEIGRSIRYQFNLR
jgi:hypothetical protein